MYDNFPPISFRRLLTAENNKYIFVLFIHVGETDSLSDTRNRIETLIIASGEIS